MAIQQKLVNVKGTDYLLNSIPAIKGTRLLKQIIQLVGPAFAEMQKEGGGIAPALEVIFDKLDQAGVEQLIIDLIALSVTKQGMNVNFDMEFASEYDRLFLLVKEVVEFNFGSVFTLLGSSANL